MLIAAQDAVQSNLHLTSTKMGSNEVFRKFGVAIDLLYDFVKDFPTLNPNICNARFTVPRITDRKSMPVRSNIIPYLQKSIDPDVEFPYDSSSLDADES